MLLLWVAAAVAAEPSLRWSVPDEAAAEAVRTALGELWPEASVDVVVGPCDACALRGDGAELVVALTTGEVDVHGDFPTQVVYLKGLLRESTPLDLGWLPPPPPAPPEPPPAPAPAPKPRVRHLALGLGAYAAEQEAIPSGARLSVRWAFGPINAELEAALGRNTSVSTSPTEDSVSSTVDEVHFSTSTDWLALRALVGAHAGWRAGGWRIGPAAMIGPGLFERNWTYWVIRDQEQSVESTATDPQLGVTFGGGVEVDRGRGGVRVLGLGDYAESSVRWELAVDGLIAF